MSTHPKKHHYIPEAHLRNFSRSDKRNQIWVYDKLKARSFSSSIGDVGCEGNFNTIELDGETINLEAMFGKIDNEGPSIVKKIIADGGIDNLSQSERFGLATVVVVQLLRTKLMRSNFVHIMRQLGESFRNSGLDPEQVSNFGIPTEGEARIMSLQALGSIDGLVESILSKICVLHCCEGSDLWISDNPVVLFNSFPYGDLGVRSLGVEIYFPISSKLLLAFYCPSIGLKVYQKVEARVVGPYFGLLYQGMCNGRAVSSSEHTHFFNSLQVGQSHRFVMSCKREFDLAEKMVREHPTLAQVSGYGSVGRFGEVRRRHSMPGGKYLVVQGDLDHLMLPVKSWSNTADEAEFEVDILTKHMPDGFEIYGAAKWFRCSRTATRFV